MSVPRICPGSGNIFAKYQGFDLSHDMLVTPCSRSWHPRVCVAALAKFSKSTQVAKLPPGLNDTLALESVDFKLDQLWFRS